MPPAASGGTDVAMKLYDQLKRGFPRIESLSCAEKILYGSNYAYNLGLPQSALRLSAGMGAGMGIGYTCGCVTAGCMVLSHLFVKEYAHESERIKELTSEYIRAVEKNFSSVVCEDLKAKYRTPEERCNYLIMDIAKELDVIVERELAKESFSAKE